VAISRKRVARLMRQAKLSGLHRPRRTRPTLRGLDLAPALIWWSGTLPARTRPGLGGRHHLHQDLGGLALPGRGDGSLQPQDRGVVDGVSSAHRARGQCPGHGHHAPQARAGLVHHSDRGCRYTSLGFGRKFRESGMPSMGAVGTAYDNAVAESFFATFKKDLIHRNG
jgi:putative transposase